MTDTAELERAVADRVRERRFAEALELLDAALALGANAALWNDWATVQHAAGHAYKAEQGYRRALQLDSDSRDAAVNLGLLLLTQGRTQEANALLEEHSASLSPEEKRAIAALSSREEELPTKVARLEAALEYLLVANLNLRQGASTGEQSNRELVSYFLRLLKLLQPEHFLEVGAHDASTGRAVKALLPGCDVWGFEANPKIFEMFSPAAAAAGVQYVNLAIARQSGRVTIYAPRVSSKVLVNGEVVPSTYVEPETTGRTSLLRRNEEATYSEFSVDAIALDEFLSRRGIVGPARNVALWIDVEGAAAEVLSSATAALGKTAVIFIESENHEFWSGQKQCGDIARILIAAGFVPLERDREYGDQQFNTVFLHHSLVDRIYPQTYQGARNLRSSAQPPMPATAVPARKRSYRSLAASLHATIPVVVPTFNNPTYTRNMLAQLAGLGFENVTLFDNASSTPEMQALLDQAEYQVRVIRSPHNHGPRHVLAHQPEYEHLPEHFVVTDPDLEFNPSLPEDFISKLIWATDYYKVGKAGMALRIDDVAQMHERKFTIQGREYHAAEWELRWWKDEVGHLDDGSRIYRAVTDTTFAVYNKKYFTPVLFFDSVRIAGHFACRHLPWYKDNGLHAREESLYRETQKWSYHMGSSDRLSEAERV